MRYLYLWIENFNLKLNFGFYYVSIETFMSLERDVPFRVFRGVLDLFPTGFYFSWNT